MNVKLEHERRIWKKIMEFNRKSNEGFTNIVTAVQLKLHFCTYVCFVQ